SDQTVDYGRVHLSVQVGYELATHGGVTFNGMGLLELGESLVLRGHASLPMVSVGNGEEGAYRIEGGAMLYRSSLAVENESIGVDQPTQGSVVHTKTLTIETLNKNGKGIGAGLIGRSDVAKLDVDGSPRSTRGEHLTAYIGF